MKIVIMNSAWYDRTPQSMALIQTEIIVFVRELNSGLQ